MGRISTSVLSVAHYGNGRGQMFGFSFRIHSSLLFYLFDRLYALKPKNPV